MNFICFLGLFLIAPACGTRTTRKACNLCRIMFAHQLRGITSGHVYETRTSLPCLIYRFRQPCGLCAMSFVFYGTAFVCSFLTLQRYGIYLYPQNL